MADALRSFHQLSEVFPIFKHFFPAEAKRTLAQALRLPPNQIHHTLIEAFTTLVSTRLFPLNDWDVEYTLEMYPSIPLYLTNYDEESDFEGAPLSTKIAATIVGAYSNADGWDSIQEELGPDHPLPSCFTDSQHRCSIDIARFRKLCAAHPYPVSSYPLVLQILGHETGCVFLDAATAYDSMPYDYTWSIKTIQTLKRQWKKSEALTQQWVAVDKALTDEPEHWKTIFSCWTHMCQTTLTRKPRHARTA
ncbi:MAG: hypothetical protein AAB433_03090 [Nitrospirota bacterium]|jgi:hypothetical protein